MVLPKEYYPTPPNLASHMASKVKMKGEHGDPLIETVLEPSAGDGNLILAIENRIRANANDFSNDRDFSPIDAIEIDEDLQTLANNAVRLHALDVGDEADAAGVVLVSRVIQPLFRRQSHAELL